jgi:2-haloacid dehalogenase
MRWVTFDCFGTLIDWNTGFAALLRPIAGDRTEALRAEYHRAERAVETKRPHILYKDVLTESLRNAAATMGIAVSDTQARTLPESWDRLPVFADVEPMLKALRASGYSTGVLTNCDDDLFALTHRSFLSPFDIVVTAEQVRDYKPSPAHFRRFAALAKPDDWVHVACSWYHDIVPAKALGVKRVWLDREGTGEDPSAASFRVTSAQDVAAAIARLA